MRGREAAMPATQDCEVLTAVGVVDELLEPSTELDVEDVLTAAVCEEVEAFWAVSNETVPKAARQTAAALTAMRRRMRAA